MRDSFWVRNPFSCIHAAALVNLGEAATGLAMFAWMQSQSKVYKGIVTKVEAVYYKKAVGRIGADTSLGDLATHAREGSFNVPVKALLTNSSGVVIGQVTAYWSLKEVNKKVN